MRLPKEGIEYARIEFDDLADTTGITVEASIDRTNWYPTTLSGGEYLFLVRGPSNPTSYGTLVPSASTIWARITGSPEVIIRKTGIVTLY